MAKTSKKLQEAMDEARIVREEAGLPDDVAVEHVHEVILRTGGDVELALTAMTMYPRPEWVSELLHLHPERPVGS